MTLLFDTTKTNDNDVTSPQTERGAEVDDAVFRRNLTDLIPHLRAFSRSLCGDATLADDVVQDALVKAWAKREQYKTGTNLKAWTFTILRNQFYSLKRRSWRQSSLDQTVAEQTLVSVDTPIAALELNELRLAMAALPDNQREALILVGAGGFSYQEAGKICGVATGTIKSRVSRARATLVDMYMSRSSKTEYRDNVHALDAMECLKNEVDHIVGEARLADKRRPS